MKIIINNITRKEAEHAMRVLHEDCSHMDDDEPGEFFKAGCRKVMFAISRALDKKS